uniref:mitogen-activated protein kinase kinase n=1 Tax=Musca domestica TaxID=7370 RepID=A0A1I8MEW5_MUSDO
MDEITWRLQSLEKRLLEQNDSSRLVYDTSPVPEVRRRPAGLDSIPNRSRMTLNLPHSPAPATESETERKLRKIHKQSGILTINNNKYKSDIKDLEHLGDLGNGTSGNVVKMRHKQSGTIIAVKQMRRTSNIEENKRILMDLDVVLKSHDCPYIVQCFGCFITDADVWICMELMSMCFDKLLKLSKKPVPEPILGKVTVATVKALSYLKDTHGVIHRDVKPSNILIDERGNIKLCDFGISGRLVDSKAATRSAGCAAYMAPERIDPKKIKYDIRADVWSLGITLVELAIARSPYEGCKTDFEVLTKVLDSAPPTLPEDEHFHFSDEFHSFVKKCLKKDHLQRPKYPELLVQPFIIYYENAEVDIPKWFKSVVDSTSIKTHRRTQIPTSMIPATYDATKHYRSPHNALIFDTSASSSSSAAAASSSLNTNPFVTGATTATATTTMTINTTKSSLATTAASASSQQSHSQIPSYYGTGSHYQPQRNNSFHREHQKHQQPSQLPQSINQYNGSNATTSTATINYNQGSTMTTTTTAAAAATSGSTPNFGTARPSLERLPSGSGSSSATSSSPLSPPSITTLTTNPDRDTKLVNEMHKLCRKSPFMPKKYNGSSSNNRYNASAATAGGGDESPKKESVLSSIGQSILRNLTTSPFSQKKNTSNTVQPNQIDPLFRMPCAQDVSYSAFDTMDHASNVNKSNATDSPALQRKRYQMGSDSKYNTTAAKKPSTDTSPSTIAASTGVDIFESFQDKPQEFHEGKTSSVIPPPTTTAATTTLTKNEAQPQRVPGNHSPLVLQRFYHQQNQLREKELERQQYQQSHHTFYNKNSPSSSNDITNPFHHPNLYHTSASSPQQQQQQHQHFSSHIPIASSSTLSSYSTSSQSSTQSSQCSQVGGDMPSSAQQQQQHHHHGPRSLPLMSSYDSKLSSSPTSPPQAQTATMGFGTNATQASPTSASINATGHLQYQPLPQHYLTNTPYANVMRGSGSPPISPPDDAGNQRMGVTSPTVSKLSKLYNQRHQGNMSPSTAAAVAASASITNANNAGTSSAATKENNYKTESATTSPTNGDTNAPPPADNNKANLFYRTMSTGSSSSPSNSQTTSPSDEAALATGTALKTPSANGSEGFYEGSSAGGFIRRYAASTGSGGSTGAGSNLNASGTNTSIPATHTPPHILANLDRRHRSPDPPPRYNRGQSPLLLRKNILELSGQPPGTSPLLNRRFVNASPPLPPPRRGSESVPGSPQHFRTRIHYTPEPQRRIYRTIDQ